MNEKNESLEAKLKEVLKKWNDERSKLIAKSNSINHRVSLTDINKAPTDTVYFDDAGHLMIKEVNLIDSFESN